MSPKPTVVKDKTTQVQTPAGTLQIEPKSSIVIPSDQIHETLRAGIIDLGALGKMPCAVLDDTTRLLSQRAMSVALGRYKNPHKGAASLAVPTFLAAKNLEPFITDEIRELWEPVFYRSKGGYGGNVAFGYDARLLPLVCSVYINADHAGALKGRQRDTAVRARLLLPSLSKLGIIALVDEATGYQEDRARDELAELLKSFLSDALRRWVKTFPDEFYKELFRLRNLTYSEFTTKRPVIIGRLTNDIIYERLAPGVLRELEKRNPRERSGRRRHKHFQWLSEDLGHPELTRHLYAVIALMRASPNWDSFYRLLQRAFPKWKDMIDGVHKDDLQAALPGFNR